jgi:hypothetical protein
MQSAVMSSGPKVWNPLERLDGAGHLYSKSSKLMFIRSVAFAKTSVHANTLHSVSITMIAFS